MYIKIIFLIIIFLIKNNVYNKFRTFDKLKICLCTIGKEENLYAREFVSHYKRYNIDKIIIYDNNEIKGEKFEDVLFDYISNGFVELIDVRGKLSQQLKVYQNCLKKFKNKFDWFIFYDMDEFIYLEKFKNLKYYLSKPCFKNCQAIQLNMYFHTDNNQLYYENKTLFERFKEKIKSRKGVLKTIIRNNIKTTIKCPHCLNKKLISCDGFGNYNKEFKEIIYTNKPDFKYHYIDHFSYKSTEEFVRKIMRGSAIKGFETEMKYRKISWYFDSNKIKKEKIDLIENLTKLNLSEYRKRLVEQNTS